MSETAKDVENKDEIQEKIDELKAKIPELTEEELKKIDDVKKFIPIFKEYKDHPSILTIPVCKTSCKFCRGRGYMIGVFNNSEQMRIEGLKERQKNITPCKKSRLQHFEALELYETNKDAIEKNKLLLKAEADKK